jgi:hypothetical protein
MLPADEDEQEEEKVPDLVSESDSDDDDDGNDEWKQTLNERLLADLDAYANKSFCRDLLLPCLFEG